MTPIDDVADRLASALPPTWDASRDLIVLVGRGGEALAATLVARGQRVLAYQPGGQAAYPRQVPVAGSLRELTDVLEPLRRIPEHEVVLRCDPSVADGTVAELRATLREFLDWSAANRRMWDAFGEQWIQNLIANLPAVAEWPSVAGVAGDFRRVPCVIVSPGPSLDKNIHLLPQLRGKAVIIASSHALKALHRASVVPDLVVVLDGQDLRYHFDGFPIEEVAAVVMAVKARSELYQLPAPRFLTFGVGETFDGWVYDRVGDPGHVMSCGSVAGAAFGLGLAWGCDPIVLVGQDLSFPDGKYYSSGNADAGLRVDPASGRKLAFAGVSGELQRILDARRDHDTLREDAAELPGYYGGRVLTSTTFQEYHRWFERTAAQVAGRVRLLNCTEGGAFLNGFEHVPLAEAIARHATSPVAVSPLLDRALSRLDRPERRRQMRDHARSLAQILDQCITQARSCVDIIETARQRKKPPQKLEPAEKRLARLLEVVKPITMHRAPDLAEGWSKLRTAEGADARLDATLALCRCVVDACELPRTALARVLVTLMEKS